MATYITHIALAKKEFSQYFDAFSERDFYIGCNFPDIRYIADIDRNATHVYNVAFKDVLNAPSSFQAGILYHCFVDELREAFVQHRGIYTLCPQSKYITQAIKLFEDEVYYSSVNGWNDIVDMLASFSPEELGSDIDQGIIRRWHTIGSQYCQQPPSQKSREMFIKSIGFDQHVVDEINSIIVTLKTIPEVHKIVSDFWNQFDDLLLAEKK